MSITEASTDATEATATPAALSVQDLQLAYTVRGVPREVLRGVTFDVRAGEAYGLVGESGCGKSTTAYAAMRYMPSNAVIQGGRVLADGQDVTAMSTSELRKFRATKASMVYQDPVQAMNPTLKVGRQVAESFRILGQNKTDAEQSARDALRRVKIADPDRVLDRYPHQLSGGMLQRVVIAMALAGDPKLLVLDEPTTGLDATVEAEVLDLVRDLRSETSAAILLIAHNLGVIRTMCDRVGVMYAGRVVEEGTVDAVFDRPSHPYTMGLLNSIPRHGVRKTERSLFTIPGNLPLIGTPLPTCVYVDRCPLADDLCRTIAPPIVPLSSGHWTRCHHSEQIDSIKAPEQGNTDFHIGTQTIVEL
ncbi:MAG: ABC transporter ATP-binding protein, partial [Ilumatobacteraceae bacterium]